MVQATNTTKNLSGTTRDVVAAELQKLATYLENESAAEQTSTTPEYALKSDLEALTARINKFNETMPSNHKI